MDNRYACAPEHVKTMDTAELRSRFLVDDLFVEGEAKFVYSHYDRIIMAGIVPSGSPLVLPTPEELHTEHLLDRREAGIVNIGQDADVTVDGQTYTVPREGLLYIGRGAKEITFAAPGRFYLYSAPAHTEYPTTLVGPDEGNVLDLGEQETSNKRKLRQLLFNGEVKTCQIMMGVTRLAPGSMWNTMPAHTHARRMESYLYFDVADDARVIHLMGEPSETRHLVVSNEQGVISPSWSIHSGVGTKAYAFIWAMAGENQAFDDMDPAPVTDLH